MGAVRTSAPLPMVSPGRATVTTQAKMPLRLASLVSPSSVLPRSGKGKANTNRSQASGPVPEHGLACKIHHSCPTAAFPKTRTAPPTRARMAVSSARAAAAAAGGAPLEALLFDCDGVLVDTERDGHRVSFNQAFREKGLEGVEWSVEEYGELLKIGGGKERMTYYFDNVGWPSTAPVDAEARKEFVAGLHKLKTSLFMDLVETGALPLRPGVATLIDEALAAGVKVAVCSTSNEKAVSAIVRVMLGPDKFQAMQIFAGDIVPKKKPDPAIYNLAATSLGVDPSRCVVVEDSHIGLTAAKAAGMSCVVTTSGYTKDEDFAAADVVFPCIGDPPKQNFNLSSLKQLAKERGWTRVSTST